MFKNFISKNQNVPEPVKEEEKKETITQEDSLDIKIIKKIIPLLENKDKWKFSDQYGYGDYKTIEYLSKPSVKFRINFSTYRKECDVSITIEDDVFNSASISVPNDLKDSFIGVYKYLKAEEDESHRKRMEDIKRREVELKMNFLNMNF